MMATGLRQSVQSATDTVKLKGAPDRSSTRSRLSPVTRVSAALTVDAGERTTERTAGASGVTRQSADAPSVAVVLASKIAEQAKRPGLAADARVTSMERRDASNAAEAASRRAAARQMPWSAAQSVVMISELLQASLKHLTPAPLTQVSLAVVQLRSVVQRFICGSRGYDGLGRLMVVGFRGCRVWGAFGRFRREDGLCAMHRAAHLQVVGRDLLLQRRLVAVLDAGAALDADVDAV